MAETAWRSFKKDKKKPGFNPSLNTQSCNKGLLGVQNFCLWAVWAGKAVLKKNLGRL